MARFDSIHWNTKDGVCKIHMLPEIPCPACIAKKHTDLELVVSEYEMEEIAWGFLTIFDVLPNGFNKEDFAIIRVNK